VIHNGVDEFWEKDVTIQNTWVSDEYTILYYGHAGYSKGIDYWIQALPEVKKRIPHAHFVFNIIDSKRTKKIIKKIKQNNLQDAITIHQWMNMEQLRHLIGRSDVVVAPSLAEWFGSVVSEVSSLQKPLVTTYAGAIPEASWWEVIHVHPSSASVLVQAIHDIYTRKRPEHTIPAKSYSRDTTVDTLESYYRKLCNHEVL
jgi:glycosyltransferase involved in cell wall biosynthesis